MFDAPFDGMDDVRLLVSLWPGPLAILDMKGRFLTGNDHFIRATGLVAGSAQHFPFGDLSEILTPDQKQALCQSRAILLPLPDAGSGRWQMTIMPGQDRLLCSSVVTNQATTAPMPTPRLIPAALTVPAVDTGCQIRSQPDEHRDWQHQKLQALGQLAGGVAHDFNNILTAIMGHCDLVLERVGPGDNLFADLIQIRHNSQRAAGLVRQLLAFSRQQTLSLQQVAVQGIMLEMMQLFRRLVGERIRVELDWCDALPPVRADIVQLEHMLVNLVVNARDAISGNGQIMLRLRQGHNPHPRMLVPGDTLPVGDYVIISVADDGPGIAPEARAHLFEPFFTTKPVGQGTGLGLAMVHGAIRQMQGYVDVESYAGQGCTFSLWFPVPDADSAAAVMSSTQQDVASRGAQSVLMLASKGEEIVLLVEDEDPVRRVTARTLRHRGYMVIEAAYGEEAMAIIRQDHQRIDLVVSDVILPDMEAPDLLDQIQEYRPGIPVLLISGYADEIVRTRIGACRAWSFLPKPFSLQDFISKVRACLDGHLNLAE